VRKKWTMGIKGEHINDETTLIGKVDCSEDFKQIHKKLLGGGYK